MSDQTSAPPVIRIKRKRDEAPLDSLFLEQSKERSKRRATDHTYVFKRLNQLSEPQVIQQEYNEQGIPKVRSTVVGEEKRDPDAVGKSVTPKKENAKVVKSQAVGPRRFHLSRMGMKMAGKREGKVATFVERRVTVHNGEVASMSQTTVQVQEQVTRNPEAFKRPTAKARVLQRQPSKTDELLVSDPELVQKMDQWSLETSKHEEEKKAAPMPAKDPNAMDVDDADYVYDTYYRELVPANTVPDKGISFGHLIIGEEEQDLWETYLDGEDSDDKEFDTDEEDSNAEDYYGADYPEEEVASDDEFGRDAYQYRKAASDEEEYDLGKDPYDYEDEDKVVGSGDEGNSIPKPVSSELLAARAWKRDFGGMKRASPNTGDMMID